MSIKTEKIIKSLIKDIVKFKDKLKWNYLKIKWSNAKILGCFKAK